MGHKKLGSVFLLALLGTLLLQSGTALAQNLKDPEVTEPADGSSFTVGSSFTATAETGCRGPSGTTCESVTLELNLPDGLSTGGTNPKSCGDLNSGDDCSKSWSVSADSIGTYDITTTADGDNVGSKTSSAISVTVEEEVEEEETAEEVSVTIKKPTTNDTFRRGDDMLVRAELGQSGSVEARLRGNKVQLRDDGQHEDGQADDLVYANRLTVPPLAEGTYTLEVVITEGGLEGDETVEVGIDPTLTITPRLEDPYRKGETIEFRGRISDVNNESMVNTDVDILVEHGSFSRNFSSVTDQNGEFFADYDIRFPDPAGEWNLTIVAEDDAGNRGVLSRALPVQVPPEGDFYLVQFTSPVRDRIHRRGDEVTVTTEVSGDEGMITDANASLRVRGREVEMIETSPGIYSIDHTIPFDAPTNYTLEVFAFKNIEGTLRGGANTLTLNLQPAEIQTEVISPSGEVTAGQSVRIAVRATYPDGSSVRDAKVTAVTPGGEVIPLREEEAGRYEATHSIQPSEQGAWFLDVNVQDRYQNQGSSESTVQIRRVTPFYLLLSYWYVVLLFLLLIGGLSYPRVRTAYLRKKLERREEELERLDEEKKGLQEDYYKEGKLSKDTYKELMNEKESRKEELQHDIEKLRDTLE